MMIDREDSLAINRCIEKLQHTEQEFINVFQILLWKRLKTSDSHTRQTPLGLSAWIDLYSERFRTFFESNPSLFREYCECKDQEANKGRLGIIEQHIYHQ